MSQVILDQPRIGTLVGQGKAARMAQHVRVRLDGQACAFAIGANRQPGGLPAKRATPFTDKERIGLGFHPRPFRQPGLDHPEFVTPERVRGGQAVVESCDVQHTAFDIHLG